MVGDENCVEQSTTYLYGLERLWIGRYNEKAALFSRSFGSSQPLKSASKHRETCDMTGIHQYMLAIFSRALEPFHPKTRCRTRDGLVYPKELRREH
jgi:hypothetical protein